MLLKKQPLNKWELVSVKSSYVFYEFIAFSERDAVSIAKKYMSSWGSVSIIDEKGEDL